MWDEMSAGEVKTIPENNTGGHAVAVVGWDKGGLWFINSWRANDPEKRKSRFYISNRILKQLGWRLNYRYWVLYIEGDALVSPEYLKRKNNYLTILQALRKIYPEESSNMQKAIEQFSQKCRQEYPELNEELPIN